MMAKGKPRKPRAVEIDGIAVFVRRGSFDGEVVIGGFWFSLKGVKRLHAWLGRAIAWLEADDG